jgi:hypothetical protein
MGRCLLALILVGPGCSPAAGTVRGLVTLGSTKVQAGRVMFCYPNGAVLAANIDPESRYELTQAPVGEVKVCVVNLYGTEDLPRLLAAERPPPPRPKSLPIPKRYQDRENGLPYTVRSGRQTFDIELTP